MKQLFLSILFVAILLLLLLLLSGCQSKELLFTGEGDQWLGTITVSQTGGDEIYTIQLNYRGDDLKAIDTFGYRVESSHNGALEYSANEILLNEKGIYKGKMLSSNSPSTTSEDELMLEVSWNDKSEKLVLKNK
ncbi:hypothetical protein [Sporosarcina sp. YIM B06819]|uniref:hypothetical protein n=1 Tax=Sporosarcina sp. YIM B06819 TaxID=3081769 RepID=UPI00298C2683|nr:hypothetical protein [Sporosarcina sp. YIM B06819]